MRQNCAIIARLEAGEDRLVDRPLEIVHDLVPLLVDLLHALAVEDHRAARPAERLVGGGRHDVRELERRRHDAGAANKNALNETRTKLIILIEGGFRVSLFESRFVKSVTNIFVTFF